MNISKFSNEQTANTSYICALQRAENLAILGCKTVLELCVGPSLKILELSYNKFGINVVGNDIDSRWRNYYLGGEWIIGDARKVKTDNFDAAVFAPPLSKSCSGCREDALSLDEVFPSYYDFLNMKSKFSVFVLPGKTLSIKKDREQLHKFLSKLNNYEIFPIKNKVNKYIDVYTKNY